MRTDRSPLGSIAMALAVGATLTLGFSGRASAQEGTELRRAKILRNVGVTLVALCTGLSLPLGAAALASVDNSTEFYPTGRDRNGKAKALGIASAVILAVGLIAGVPMWEIGQTRMQHLQRAQEAAARRAWPSVQVALTSGGGWIALSRRF